MDTVSPEKRSWMMSRIKSKNTRPELVVRSLLHRMGYRFRLHRKELPGNPDIILPKYRVVIFVHGCFWHRHTCKSGSRLPKSNLAYWLTKLERNQQRDKINREKIEHLGWTVLIIWDCLTKDLAELQSNLEQFFFNLPKLPYS